MPFLTPMHPIKKGSSCQENASVGKFKPLSAVVAWQGTGGRGFPCEVLRRAPESEMNTAGYKN